MSRYLLCYDGSLQSRAALAWLAHFVRPADIVVVFQSVAPASRILDIGSNREDLVRDRQKAANESLEEVTTILTGVGLPVDSVLSETPVVSDAREAVLAIVEKYRIDVIFSGTRGHGAITRAVLGSFSEYLVTHAECAVLVANRPPGQEAGSTAPLADAAETLAAARRPLRILISVDDTPASLAASDVLGRIATVDDAIDLVTVRDFPQEYDVLYSRGGTVRIPNPRFAVQAAENKAAYTQTLRRARHAVVHGVASRHPSYSSNTAPVHRLVASDAVKTRVIDSPSVRDALGEYTRAGMYDLAVSGSRQLGRAKRFVVGSVSHYLLHEADAAAVLIASL